MNYKDSSLISKIKEIITEAGKATLEIYNSPDIGLEIKSDESPLTKADQASHNIILKGLSSLNVQIPVISEEHKNQAFAERRDESFQWIVDPLDGTKEFVKRNGEFTINIGLLEGSEVVMGCVYIPVQDALYWAVKGEGAYRQKDGQEVSLHAPSFSLKESGLSVVCSRSHLNEETTAFLHRLDQARTISFGSSLKFLKIAEGDAELYPRIAPTMEWDTAAAQIILEEAGGKVIQWQSTDKVIYNKENLLNPYFVALGRMKEDLTSLWQV